MTGTAVRPAEQPLSGSVRVPPDKSISHRVAILGALAEGTTAIHGYSPADDCASTLSVLRALGVGVETQGEDVSIHGIGTREFAEPEGVLDCGRSGTTMRMMAGVVAGRPFHVTLDGHEQLRRRPMGRVAEPLRLMGADVETSADHPPISISPGGELIGIRYAMPMASAQVKSAILLAGLRARGSTTVIEPAPSRDHTERLLAAMGASVEREGAAVSLKPGTLRAVDVRIPGDFSSAAPLMAAAALVPGSDLLLTGVGANPTRSGFAVLLERMGAKVEVTLQVAGEAEPVADYRIAPAPLVAARVEATEVPSLIDELPLIGLLATQAEGETEVRGAGELRVKESDRVASLVSGLRALGATVEELPDGFVVRGPTRLSGGVVDAKMDHRLAMTFAVAGLVASGPVRVEGMEFVGDSFPGFAGTLESLR